MEVSVSPEHSPAIQVGRTVVILEMKREADVREKQKIKTQNLERGDFRL